MYNHLSRVCFESMSGIVILLIISTDAIIPFICLFNYFALYNKNMNNEYELLSIFSSIYIFIKGRRSSVVTH